MKMVFASVYLNNHQLFLANAFRRLCADGYRFVETLPPECRGGRLGDGTPTAQYVLRGFEPKEQNECAEWVETSDVVITGGCYGPVERRIAADKLTFRYAERPLKDGNVWYKRPVRLLRWRLQNPPKKQVYMLCASAYTARDYQKYGLFRNKCFKWGYFPETRKYPDLEALFAHKEKTTILWCGRFLEWKHPMDAVKIARRLKAEGITFQLKMIGSGPLKQALQQRIQKENLQEQVVLLGALEPDRVREEMENAGVFLFTSDRREGWGVVLNEAMNSGCAVVASNAIGAVPYLVKNEENGLVYHSGDLEGLYAKTRRLLEKPLLQEKLGHGAYRTIIETWNAEVAAQRFMQLSKAILAGDPYPVLFEDGPCSPAQIINEDWYQR